MEYLLKTGVHVCPFPGDGLSFRGIVGSEDDYKMTVEQRSSYFELPSLFNIGMSYDILILDHRITNRYIHF